MAKLNSRLYPICKKLLLNIVATIMSANFLTLCNTCSYTPNDIIIHWICYCPANETTIRSLGKLCHFQGLLVINT